ncbi:CLUMA_CG016810, isoform A [Clunio marinus]|uniref:CLUMA_CG016810, isoform A n=1 Tax=Clunio marinus TaxID=568069 RepID=A0A1J1ITJ9_9DIPT|nr:CLUMA_CG016810, isoform A [Clunio marinus]
MYCNPDYLSRFETNKCPKMIASMTETSYALKVQDICITTQQEFGLTKNTIHTLKDNVNQKLLSDILTQALALTRPKSPKKDESGSSPVSLRQNDNLRSPIADISSSHSRPNSKTPVHNTSTLNSLAPLLDFLYILSRTTSLPSHVPYPIEIRDLFCVPVFPWDFLQLPTITAQIALNQNGHHVID